MKPLQFISATVLMTAATATVRSSSGEQFDLTAYSGSHLPQWSRTAWADSSTPTIQEIVDLAIRTDRRLCPLARHVKVVAINDTVTLAGWVDSPSIRAALEEKARKVANGAPLESTIAVR